MHRPTRISDALELAELLRPSWNTITAGIAEQGVPTCLQSDDSDLKGKLTKIESELATERTARTEALSEREDAKDAYAKSGSTSQDSPEFQAAKAAVAKVGGHDDRIAELQEQQVTTLKLLGRDGPSAEKVAAGNPSDPRGDVWNSSNVFADEDKRALLAHAATSKSRFGGIDLGAVASRDAMVADVTATASQRRGDYIGVVPALRRQLRLLDLIPTGTMDANVLPYTQETGSFDTALETAEGTAKPEGAFTPVDATATAATIAHWQKLQKQSLSDYAALQGIIDGRLRYGVLRRLEGQIINGSGAGANMLGILQTSGIAAVAFSAGALIADQILKGITTVYLADAEATGIVLHPTDWQNALLAKAAGDGHYFSGGPFSVTPQQMWGVPLVPSVKVTQGTSLVGDFEIGAQLFIREGVHVLLSDSDQDDFIKNKVTLLAEMRAALAVFRPAAFAAVALQ